MLSFLVVQKYLFALKFILGQFCFKLGNFQIKNLVVLKSTKTILKTTFVYFENFLRLTRHNCHLLTSDQVTMDLVGFDFEAASQNSISYVTSMAASAAYSAAAMVNFDTTVEGFPETELPVWIMGRSYSAIHGKGYYCVIL